MDDKEIDSLVTMKDLKRNLPGYPGEYKQKIPKWKYLENFRNTYREIMKVDSEHAYFLTVDNLKPIYFSQNKLCAICLEKTDGTLVVYAGIDDIISIDNFLACDWTVCDRCFWSTAPVEDDDPRIAFTKRLELNGEEYINQNRWQKAISRERENSDRYRFLLWLKKNVKGHEGTLPNNDGFFEMMYMTQNKQN